MNEVGVLLLGVLLGWLVIFAVRRNRVQWGAFAGTIAVIFGVGMLGFLYARQLLGFYAIGAFLGFFVNLGFRAAGVAIGGKVGEGLLEISAYRGREGSR